MISKNGSSKVDPTLHSPRILCLHGGGSTAEVFRIQARTLISSLSPTFRLVFADGPFTCEPGPGILPVYANLGPYRRWLRWLPHHQAIDANLAIDKIWFQLRAAMNEDTAQGADGPWVGLMGFSQGAKLSACLLFDQQMRMKAARQGDIKALEPATTWKFGVLLAGGAPLVWLSEYSAGSKYLVNAADISEGFENIPPLSEAKDEFQKQMLRIPTIHVHGLKDPGIHSFRLLLNGMDRDTVTLVEWDGNHRVPVSTVEVDEIVRAIMNVARKTGAIP